MSYLGVILSPRGEAVVSMHLPIQYGGICSLKGESGGATPVRKSRQLPITPKEMMVVSGREGAHIVPHPTHRKTAAGIQPFLNHNNAIVVVHVTRLHFFPSQKSLHLPSKHISTQKYTKVSIDQSQGYRVSSLL
jgi:hypothetical protein